MYQALLNLSFSGDDRPEMKATVTRLFVNMRSIKWLKKGKKKIITGLAWVKNVSVPSFQSVEMPSLVKL